MDNALLNILNNSSITDIIVLGSVENENEIWRFYPDMRSIYIEFSSSYFMLESIAQYSLLRFSVVDDIKFNYEIDEDMQRAKSSIREIVLDNCDAIGNRICEIKLYDRTKHDVCAAMELRLDNGQMIFIDPSFLFGINIGGERKKEIWKENYPNIDDMHIETIIA